MTDVRCGAQEPHANDINHDCGSETEVPHPVKRNRIKSLWNLLAMVKRKGTALAERSPQPYNCIPGKNDSTVTLNSTKRRNLSAEDPQEDQPEILRRRSPRLYNYSSATNQDPGIPFDSPPQRRSINKGKEPAQPSRDEDQGGVPLQNSAYEQPQKSNSPQDIHDEPPTYNTGSSSKVVAPGLTENGKRRHASVKPQRGLDGFRCDCSNSTDKPHGTSDSCGAQEATVQEYMKRAPKLEDQGEPLGAVHDHKERASNPADQEERNSTRKARKGRETDPWFSAVLGSSSRPIDLCSSSSSPQDSGSGSASASNAAFLIVGTSNTTATSQSQTIATEATWLGYWTCVEEEKPHHCVICMEDLPVESFSIVRITNKCEHFQDACKECVAASISAQFESKMWDQLKCPLCPELLSHEEIQEHASPAIFEKYSTLLLAPPNHQIPANPTQNHTDTTTSPQPNASPPSPTTGNVPTPPAPSPATYPNRTPPKPSTPSPSKSNATAACTFFAPLAKYPGTPT